MEYKIGSFVIVKYFNGDINIEDLETKTSIPYEALTEITKYQEQYKMSLPSNDTVIIDGVEYTRKFTNNKL